MKAYNNEAQTASGYYDNYERIYVVTPLSHNQYDKTLRRIQEATAEQDETKFEQVTKNLVILLILLYMCTCVGIYHTSTFCLTLLSLLDLF